MDPRTEQYTLSAFLVEDGDEDPVLYVDLNEDRSFTANEKITLSRKGRRTWETTILLPIKEGSFKFCPILVQYLENTTAEKMGPEDRLIMQSSAVLARGTVNVKGKNVTVQYVYTLRGKTITPQAGWLGVDVDEDGKVDMANLSPESAKANDESVVFRVGTLYLSTKKADPSKNEIILREHAAKEYKRNELYLDREFPDFGFTDFEGKKRKLSEFRGKYVLLDVWGLWCGPCREELPYIREAHKRFTSRGLEIIGLNTDPDYTVDSMKQSLAKNGMIWTQGQFESVMNFLRDGLRINSFPTTFLLSPEGKILSMSREERGEPSLRKRSLLTSLDKILPKE